MEKKLSEYLTCAADLIEQKGWVQGAPAVTETGRIIGSKEPAAARFCFMGALKACGFEDIDREIRALENRKTPYWFFNDRETTTKEKVIARLRKLARLAARKELEEAARGVVL